LREPEKILPNRKGKKKRSITRKRDCSERDKEKKPAIQLIIANRRGDREREMHFNGKRERERIVLLIIQREKDRKNDSDMEQIYKT
jgi:hypothetical protein